MKLKIILYFTLTITLSLIFISCDTSQTTTTTTETTTTTSLTTETTTTEENVDLSIYDSLTGRLITFFDDFNGDELDETVWEHMIGTGSAYGLGYWGNNEQQYYKSENTTVENGELRIEIKKEQTVADNGSGTIMEYTSSRLRTKGGFSQKYGRIEARIRIDTAEQGLWPAFWMLSENSEYGGWPYSGEIDIMEIRGSRPFYTSSALHFFDDRHTYITNEIQFKDSTSMTDYHVYALEWTPFGITTYVDDEVVLSTDAWESNVGDFPAPFDKKFHILLNVAVGGNFDGNKLPSDELLPATMYVDYVKVLAYDDEDGRKAPVGNGDVYLTYDELTISLSDEPVDLEYFVFDGKRTDVAWFSSDTSVAVVNQGGRVTPLSVGTTTIRVATATSEALCIITVTNEEE